MQDWQHTSIAKPLDKGKNGKNTDEILCLRLNTDFPCIFNLLVDFRRLGEIS